VAGEWDPERGGYKWKSLKFCADWYGYTNYKPHDALEDVRATLHCYYAMRKGGRR
jgi:DNA polymerase III epsilon subunit-like protein